MHNIDLFLRSGIYRLKHKFDYSLISLPKVINYYHRSKLLASGREFSMVPLPLSRPAQEDKINRTVAKITNDAQSKRW